MGLKLPLSFYYLKDSEWTLPNKETNQVSCCKYSLFPHLNLKVTTYPNKFLFSITLLIF